MDNKTNLKQKIKEELKHKREKLTESSLNTYSSLLVNLLHKMKTNDLKEFDDAPKVIEFIKQNIEKQMS
jgi:hypothetical protein